ncbi:hypothetical protein B0H34DRAFT_104331 [Crassisporium funariophilum]|nr:hypothetical protein B0H34DRAFT_104331 [Crassisporium funariophilum]
MAPTSSLSSTLSRRESSMKGTRRHAFSDKTPEAAAARATYLKMFIAGSFLVIVIIFAIFPIFWGALWKTPAHNLPGWVVDFDGGLLGQGIAQALNSQPASGRITWTVVAASQFPGGVEELEHDVLDEQTWVAISINEGSTARLSASLASPNSSYDGTEAITVFAVEARNENAFRSMIRPTVQATLDAVSRAIAIQTVQRIANSSTLSSIMTTSPQTIVQPVSYRIKNLAPFDIPVASAVTFVGLLYQLILSFFIVMIGHAAREASGLDKSLSTQSLITLRLISSFSAYFIISLFYSLLNVAFQIDLTRRFGHAGFMVFWMVNYAGMLSVGLALESLMTLLTIRFIAFFMLTWIITNISVCIFPLETLPGIFRYGYAAPFYNLSHALRTIIFGTRNRIGFCVAVLIVWIAISCISLPLIQWFVRRMESGTPQTQSASPQDRDVTESKELSA